jgi:phosphoribosylanthranilate isomerase
VWRAVRVEAKICGLTRPEDAALAVELGAWRLGVIFAGGPRVVTAAQARGIVDAGAGVPVLGVFGPQPVATMLDTMRAAGLAGAQLHGDHLPDAAEQLHDQGFEVWRVLAITEGMDVTAEVRAAGGAADALLVEARVAGGSGGKGIAIPLDVARAARLAAPATRFVLAGGLTPESVVTAIRVVGPDAVDVSSGVESSPGIKDRARLARFLENVFAARPAA